MKSKKKSQNPYENSYNKIQTLFWKGYNFLYSFHFAKTKVFQGFQAGADRCVSLFLQK